jgi:hypothetical protein
MLAAKLGFGALGVDARVSKIHFPTPTKVDGVLDKFRNNFSELSYMKSS